MLKFLEKIKAQIPNTLTWMRGIFSLIIILLFILKPESYKLYSLTLFILASLTDFFDGYFARKWNVVSNLGKIIDPLFDKLLVFSLLILLFPLNIVPKIAIIILLTRDITTDIMRYILLYNKKVVAAINSAKYKTTFQLITIALALVHLNLPEQILIQKVAYTSSLIAVFFSLYSGYLYTKNFINHFKGKEKILSKK